MTKPARKIYSAEHVEEANLDKMIVKYMLLWKFRDLVAHSALYFPRIDAFEDVFEGVIPQAVWDLNVPAFKQWYERCKKEIFVSCWNLDEEEDPKMWEVYAKNFGVRITTTVGLLTGELSHPSIAEEQPYEASVAALAKKMGFNLADPEPPPHDGFTLGKIKYVGEHGMDAFEVLGESLSNVVPVFRKLHGYEPEHEYRAILRSGSLSGVEARDGGLSHVHVPIRLEKLIQEIRFSPVNDPALGTEITTLLANGNSNIPVVPSSLGLSK